MWPWLKRFFYDEDAFKAALGSSVQRIGLVVFALATALSSGIITLDQLGADFGRAGWWAGRVLTLVGIVMLVGDRTPKPLKRLSPEAAEALAAHAESLPVPQKPPVI